MTYLQRKKLAFMSIVNQIKGFVRSVSGIPPLTLPDCVDEYSLIDYSISGNSVQNGTPTPDAPVEVESVGEYDEETGKYKIPVVCSGKNLFDKDNANLFAGYFSNNQLQEYNPNIAVPYNLTFCIPCKPNTTYTVSRKILSKRFGIAYSEFAPATDIAVTHKGGSSSYSLTLTTNETARYLYVWFYNKTYDTAYSYSELMDGIQIEKGTVATDYEPYVEPITTNIYLDEPLSGGQTINSKTDNLPTLPTFKGTTIMSVDTKVQPSDMSATYYSTSKE